MPRPKLPGERKRIGIYIEVELVTRFKDHFTNYGDFTTVINDILRTKLNELDHLKAELRARGMPNV